MQAGFCRDTQNLVKTATFQNFPAIPAFNPARVGALQRDTEIGVAAKTEAQGERFFCDTLRAAAFMSGHTERPESGLEISILSWT
jgi:hypothetical protein